MNLEIILGYRISQINKGAFTKLHSKVYLHDKGFTSTKIFMFTLLPSFNRPSVCSQGCKAQIVPSVGLRDGNHPQATMCGSFPPPSCSEFC